MCNDFKSTQCCISPVAYYNNNQYTCLSHSEVLASLICDAFKRALPTYGVNESNLLLPHPENHNLLVRLVRPIRMVDVHFFLYATASRYWLLMVAPRSKSKQYTIKRIRELMPVPFVSDLFVSIINTIGLVTFSVSKLFIYSICLC